MKKLNLLFLLLSPFLAFSQNSDISGQLEDNVAQSIIYANIVLHNALDSSLVKVETTDVDGNFQFLNIPEGSYYVISSYIGYDDLKIEDIIVAEGRPVELGTITMRSSAVELETAVISAKRAMVEVKPDRTVFNVQGTINSVGDNGLDLLRKAPGVLLDNNNNVTVLGRSGVIFYVDGKRLPLAGDDLSNYLMNLTADQIDRIDIISNPGAKYEAEGNAGIIDIRLKKDKSHGFNGTLSSSYSKGIRDRWNVNSTGNYRNSKFNTFGMLGYNNNQRYELYNFLDFQNGLYLDKQTELVTSRKGMSYRWGTDFFIGKNSTIGFLINGNEQDGGGDSESYDFLARDVLPRKADSILIAGNEWDQTNTNNSYNLNYAYANGGKTLNIDADYGSYERDAQFVQPNVYYTPNEDSILTQNISESIQPVDIEIATFKIDYEQDALGGKLGIGTKVSNVATDNYFKLENFKDGQSTPRFRAENDFLYNERVYAGYISFNGTINERMNFSSGLRVENTDAEGDLKDGSGNGEPPVLQNYTNFFPSFGLTYSPKMGNTWAFNYGRRINRPDYNVLNPFEVQLSEISFSKGNAFLQPEIVNNMELGYTLNWKYNFKLAYSITSNQITRLIAPDSRDPRAGFINWDNLAEQRTLSFNISAPITITEKWNAFFNLSASHLDNQADYGDGNTVDLQAYTYNIFGQNTFTLPKGFTGEISGWFAGPGIWGGVFEYDTSWSLNLGLSKQFFEKRMNVKLSASDIFNQAFWSGFSQFAGLRSEGKGQWDSRRLSLNVSYNFGNQNVKSRNRKTGIEDESSRVSEN